MDRREFLESAVARSMAILAGTGWAAAARAFTQPGGREPLTGSCLAPLSETERTLAALLDTVVPGPGTDPEGAPGAVEACAMNVLLDAAFPFRQYADAIAMLVEGIAQSAHGAAFVSLPYAKRLDVLVSAQDQLPLLRLAYRGIRSAFFGGAYNTIGLEYIGFPGPNLGYRHVPECSFREAVCGEMTATGWMP